MEYMVREDGKNGSVEINGPMIVRTIKKRLGKDDVLTIPVRSVAGVFHDRRKLGTDTVKVSTPAGVYEWKVKDAEGFVAALNTAVAGVS